MNDLAQKKPKINDDFKLEEIDGEVLLYSPKATQAIYLNASASVIWQLCTGEFTTQEIIDLLQQQFPDESASIAKDINETITQLVDCEAIELI